MDGAVPVCFRVAVQRRKHDGEDDSCVFANQVDDVFVVPVVQGAFSNLEWSNVIKQICCYLKMRT